MDKKSIDRINILAKKSKTIGLTPEEKEEQQLLRKEYLAAVRKNFRQTLEQIKIED